MTFFSKIYQNWESIQREKYETISNLLKEHRIKLSGKVIDVGCGPMFFEKFLGEKGVDTSIFICADIEKQKSAKMKFIVASGDNLPYADGVFDTVFCLDTIHLLKDATELERVLKKGGYLVLSSFFNSENFLKVDKDLDKKLSRFKIINKTILKGRESEIIIIARK